MSSLKQLGVDLGELCEEKRAAYGASVSKSATILAILYPNGLRPEQYFDAITAARITDKLSRLAQGNDPHGESPYVDIGGYALVALQHHSREVQKAPCASASAAGNPSQAPSDSAPNDAAAPTMPSASAKSERSSTAPFSAPSRSASASTEAASAPSATANVLDGSDVLQSALASNCAGCCAHPRCNTFLGRWSEAGVVIDGRTYRVCGLHCANTFPEAIR